jgi:DNA-binding CsgD family transcriptional regulator/tetratricopeptide (TPR) repeat protein
MPRAGPVSFPSRAFIGRDDELAALRRAWRQGGTACVVSSAAGVGKSRLVRELASWSLTEGAVVLTGRCTPTGRDVPLRPWREALLSAARAGRRPGTQLAQFVPSLARVVPEWGDGDADGSALVLGEAVLRLLPSWAASGATTLLVIEDLQWADPESLAVLEYVVDNLTGVPLLIVATLRNGEPGMGAALAADLVARRAATAVPLAPLSDGQVLAVARSCLADDQLPDEVAATLVARCDGVPFLVEELLATAVQSGWDSIANGVPGSVAASVTTRLDELPSRVRSLLAVAALLGRNFDWVIAAAAARVADDEATELLRLAVQAQLVDVEGAGFRFRHALTRDAVLATALPVEQTVMAARALDAITTADPALPGERCVLAAGLAGIAGQRERAATLWLRAAERALEEGSLESAESLASRAAAGDQDDARVSADRVLLQVWAQAGQIDRASALGQELLEFSTDALDRAEVHLVLGAALLAAGRWVEADAHAGAARELASADPARRARADAVAAQAAMGRLEPDVAAALARSALAAAQDTGQPAVECEALEVIGRAERGRDVAAAEAAFSQALDVATRAGLRLWRARAMQELGTIDMFHAMSPDRLLAARRMAVEAGALAMAAVVDLQLGALYEERGEVAEALDAARRCEAASRRWGLSTLPMSLAVQAFAHAQVADRAAAEAAIEAALATGQDRPHIEARAAGNVRAVLHIANGDLEAAARAIDDAMATLRARPGATHTFPGLWALLRTILDEGGDAARAEVAALPVDTPMSRAMNLAAEAVAAGRADRKDQAAAMVAEVDAGFAGPGRAFRRAFVRHLVASAAHTDGWGDPVGWLRESLATFEATGHDAFSARCRALLKDIGAPVPRKGRGDLGVVPPSLAALGITGREADVLALVASGATNREVGDRLFISIRTVDKHVERLLHKAGTSRAGLADLARQAGLLRT